MNKIIIIGGGLTGLYTSLKLLQRGYKTIIYDVNSKLGGKIKTVYDDDYIIEAGPNRFNSHHKILISLIEKYNLELEENKKEKYFYNLLDNKKRRCKDKSDKYIKEVLQYSEKLSKKDMLGLNFEQLCHMSIGFKKTKN